MSAILLALIIATGLALLGTIFLFRYLHRRIFIESLQQTLLSIRLPRLESNDNSNFKEEINISSQLFSLLASSKKPFTLETAVSHVGESIHFFLSVPQSTAESALRQIHGLWPEADIKPISDFNIFNPAGAVSAVYLKNSRDQALPLRTYIDIDSDTFAPILSGLSKINEVGEGAAFQISIQPVKGSAVKKRVLTAIANLKAGKSEQEVLGLDTGWVKGVKKAVNPLPSSQKTTPEDQPASPVAFDEDLINALNAKISKPLFDVNIRLVASALTKPQADSIIEGIVAGFSQLSGPKRNELKVVRPSKLDKIIYNFSFRLFNQRQSFVLNADEIASLFHLPTSATNIPRISWLKSHEASPPNEINQVKDGVIIGSTSFRNEAHPVYISDEDRRRHVYMIGQTGTGKSTLITNMVLSDIKRGHGVCLIDPHGDLVETVTSLIPDDRLDDLVIFDPGEFSHPLGLNMLEYNPERPEEKTFIVNEIQGIFNRLFPPETMGPMFEQYMRNALLLLMEDSVNEPATLIEVPRIFTDKEFRQRKLTRIHNPSVIDFWEKEASKAGGDASLENITPYITSKFNNFIANDYVRPIIGQTTNSLNFRHLMDNRKILLVNLSKGRLGDINAGLIGMIVVGKILLAALSRHDLSAEQRLPFNLFIDEFQNFTTDSISTILSEARKYSLNLTLAHQFIAQLTDDIREAIFGNVGSVISFRIGATDSETLLKQFEPTFTTNDLINIDNFNAYVKLLINGQPSTPFNIRTLPSDHANTDRATQIKNAVIKKFGRPRAEVEADILSRLRT